MPPTETLAALIARHPAPGRFIADHRGRLPLTRFTPDLTLLRNRHVAIFLRRQLHAAQALVALDGVAASVIPFPPDISCAAARPLLEAAGADAILADGSLALPATRLPVTLFDPAPAPRRVGAPRATAWLLFTSGTSSRPKLVIHDLASLTAAFLPAAGPPSSLTWSTFYDIRRYGGLQILLRALTGGGSMVLSDGAEPTAAFLARAAAGGVTHISGTPSHWRRALMSPAIAALAPAYIRLSGEIADQPILDQLQKTFPAAIIAHAFAATEAGVGFEVRDGQTGFPAAWLRSPPAGVELKLMAGALHLRSPCIAAGYAGRDNESFRAADGFIDTGDLVEIRGARCHFIGRREGTLNVGGQKVHPEEVEAILNLHPSVHLSRVQGRANPITGTLITAQIMLKPAAAESFETVTDEILRLCRAHLPAHKIPTQFARISEPELSAAGKLPRAHA